MKKSSILFLVFSLLSFTVKADSPTVDGVSKTELENIVKEFSANFIHTSVSSASSLGDLWGIDLGLVLGVTKTPQINALVKADDASKNVDSIPHLHGVLAVSVPLGFTGEIGLLPKQENSEVFLEVTSFAIKWTFTDLFFESDLYDGAIKVHHSSSTIGFKQTINNSSTSNTNVSSTVSYEQDVSGAAFIGSMDLFLVEPYIGLGFLKSDSTVKVEATASSSATIFDQTFSTSQSENISVSSSHFFIGAQMNLLFIHLGLEMAKAFDTTKYTGKFSLYF